MSRISHSMCLSGSVNCCTNCKKIVAQIFLRGIRTLYWSSMGKVAVVRSLVWDKIYGISKFKKGGRGREGSGIYEWEALSIEVG